VLACRVPRIARRHFDALAHGVAEICPESIARGATDRF
jgi:hypothetical protein